MALYDPAPRETVEAPSLDFTVAELLAWAKGKPSGKAYEYCDNDNCAIAQFLRETGRAKRPRVVDSDWRDGMYSRDRHPIDHRVNEAAVEAENFGALVKRLEALS